MSAQILLDAAKVLRERASAATPGPWTQSHDDFYGPQAEILSEHEGQPGFISGATTDEYRGAENAAYIAAMHPGVGRVLAEWLDDHASDHDAYDCGWVACRGVELARLVLGGAS